MDGIEPADLARLLGSRGRFPGPILVFDTVESTQDEAERWVQAGNLGPALFLARAQRSGRGRLGRSWHSPPGGLYATLCLRPAAAADRWPALAVVAGLAVVETLAEAGVDGLELKWPNDCRVGGCKLAGILSQALPDAGAVLVGLGLNVVLDGDDLPGDLAGRVIGLSGLLPADRDPLAVCADVLQRVRSACEDVGRAVVVDPERVHRFLAIGSEVVVGGRRGRVRGVTRAGALVLGIGDEDVAIDVGEVFDAGRD